MKERLNFFEVDSRALKSLYGLEVHLAKCGLEATLLHLVKLRVSQISCCAYCLDMYSKDLRAAGDNEQRLPLLDGWRDAHFYSEPEPGVPEPVHA